MPYHPAKQIQWKNVICGSKCVLSQMQAWFASAHYPFVTSPITSQKDKMMCNYVTKKIHFDNLILFWYITLVESRYVTYCCISLAFNMNAPAVWMASSTLFESNKIESFSVLGVLSPCRLMILRKTMTFIVYLTITKWPLLMRPD